MMNDVKLITVHDAVCETNKVHIKMQESREAEYPEWRDKIFIFLNTKIKEAIKQGKYSVFISCDEKVIPYYYINPLSKDLEDLGYIVRRVGIDELHIFWENIPF